MSECKIPPAVTASSIGQVTWISWAMGLALVGWVTGLVTFSLTGVDDMRQTCSCFTVLVFHARIFKARNMILGAFNWNSVLKNFFILS